MKLHFSLARCMLHLEGLSIFVAALYLYHTVSANWGLFMLLFFIPDLSVLGYITRNKKTGAFIYNLVHNYILALFLIVVGHISGNFLLYTVGIILGAHISFDRFLGFGIRYTDVFRVTHLQKV